MANTWMSDWHKITDEWDVVADAEKFSAIGRLLEAANYKGRSQERAGEPVKSVPEYVVPDL